MYTGIILDGNGFESLAGVWVIQEPLTDFNELQFTDLKTKYVNNFFKSADSYPLIDSSLLMII